MDDFATVDTKIAAGNMAIGESSNLAQLCQTYSYSFLEDKEKYDNYACILAVLAQAAIDSAKRRFDIDINEEIKRIKSDMNVDENGYPAFWFILQRKNKFSKGQSKSTSMTSVLNNPKCNPDLVCPMNYLFNIKIPSAKSKDILKNSVFFVKYPLELGRKRSKKIENLIEKYEVELSNYNRNDSDSTYELLDLNFDELIDEIKGIYISDSYVGLMSWLIDRALFITPALKPNRSTVSSNVYRNRSVLLKILYNINKDALLSCFSGHMQEKPIKKHD